MSNLPIKKLSDQELADIWPEYVNHNERMKTEGPFLLKTLESFNCRRVLDAAAGMGCEASFLALRGYNVHSNEISDPYMGLAKAHARRAGAKVEWSQHDWKIIGSKFLEGYFDAVIVFGNSLVLLQNHSDVLRSLKQFYKLIKKGGVLIVDERNYERYFDHKEEILNGGGEVFYKKFFSGKYIYCSSRMRHYPVSMTDSEIKWAYELDGKKLGYDKHYYPFRKGQLARLIKSARFKKVQTFSDFKPGWRYNSDFVQYVAIK